MYVKNAIHIFIRANFRRFFQTFLPFVIDITNEQIDIQTPYIFLTELEQSRNNNLYASVIYQDNKFILIKDGEEREKESESFYLDD